MQTTSLFAMPAENWQIGFLQSLRRGILQTIPHAHLIHGTKAVDVVGLLRVIRTNPNLTLIKKGFCLLFRMSRPTKKAVKQPFV